MEEYFFDPREARKLIPKELELEERQQRELHEWFCRVVRPYGQWRAAMNLDDEEVTPVSPITFHIRITGIGNEITATAWDGKFTCNLSIDDDNELVRRWDKGIVF